MKEGFVTGSNLLQAGFVKEMKKRHKPLSFSLELTARCNNNCRHCYINLPADDNKAIERELPFEKIKKIIDEAVSLGSLWCLITGGEPFLRKDFPEVYLYLKKRGILVSVFTNANLVTREHVDILRRYPPRDIEITVYGVTEETYERITMIPGSFGAFIKGLKLFLDAGVKVRLKAMVMRSNLHELPQMSRLCRKYTKDYFRFDPFLHLRFDGDRQRNAQIKSERLTPEEVVFIEENDQERFAALTDSCDKFIDADFSNTFCNHLFRCGAGRLSFAVSHDGYFRLCSALVHPDCSYDLKNGSLSEAWEKFAPSIRDTRSDRKVFLNKCSRCELINLCLWCPAHSYLENGELDRPVGYFCQIAHARCKMLGGKARV